MQGKRLDRVGNLIQMELSQLILHRVKDPRIGFVTVTHVSVAADIRSARVFYSVMGDEKAKRNTQIALEKAAGFLQREIAEVIELRCTPKLTFSLDESLDRGMEIDSILRNIDGEKNVGNP
ncbi:MAG: 30S ribosome-binding factor RbfA [Candidatus Omnitrophica bacterium]|nr:30S ribosome-binding factor RbfA [Candidatus Omnitrophota bacterium]